MSPQRELEKKALMAKAEIERQTVYLQWQKLKNSSRPEALKSELVQLGTDKLVQALPNAAGVFSLLEKYPYLSVRVAKTLLSLTTSRHRLIKPIAIGLASWFIAKRFSKQDIGPK